MPSSVVIEITEHQATDCYARMREVVTHCRDMGFQIALDDLGAGYSGLRLWTELRPDYVKLDKHFINGIQSDPVKISFVRSIRSIARSLNCQVIAEGVETEAEFRIIQNLGISYAQGFYFAKPAPVPLAQIDRLLLVTETMEEAPQTPLYTIVTAANIAKNISPLLAETPIAEVMEWFQSHPELNLLPLLDNQRIFGLIFRDRFYSQLFSSRYGLELYGKKPIKLFVDAPALVFEHNTPLESVSQQLTSNEGHSKAFFITRNSEYMGIGTVWDLLEEITQQQMYHAQHANPLTLLPGSVPINDYINRLLDRKQAFTVGYFDLDSFKPFNDVYGYNAGDDIIKAVADTLQKHVHKDQGLVGHIGGDDFIVVFTSDNWLPCCQAVLNDFQYKVAGYYRPEDVSAGGIHATDRSGSPCFFPLISLSVGIVAPDVICGCQSHVDIADFATGAKKFAKQIPGNSYFIMAKDSLGDFRI
jgi:GGDEF domain-containing protein